MKKPFWRVFLYVCAALLALCFAVSLYYDYTELYQFGSAPFYLYIIERFIMFGIPSLGCLIAAVVTGKKSK